MILFGTDLHGINWQDKSKIIIIIIIIKKEKEKASSHIWTICRYTFDAQEFLIANPPFQKTRKICDSLINWFLLLSEKVKGVIVFLPGLILGKQQFLVKMLSFSMAKYTTCDLFN